MNAVLEKDGVLTVTDGCSEAAIGVSVVNEDGSEDYYQLIGKYNGMPLFKYQRTIKRR